MNTATAAQQAPEYQKPETRFFQIELFDDNIAHKCKIDLVALRAKMRETEEFIRAVKKILGSRHEVWIGDQQWRLRALKTDATNLYLLRSWMRGKLHSSAMRPETEVDTREPAIRAQ